MKNTLPILGDIPLQNAVLAWNPTGTHPMIGVVGRVVVLPCEHHDDRNTINWFAELRVSDSFYPSQWRNECGPEDGILLNLLAEAWRIVLFGGVRAEDMHSALMVIPEYRARLGVKASAT